MECSLDFNKVMECRYELPNIITDTYGLNEYTELANFKLRPNSPRRIDLTISTYRGVCSNAIHYYGRVDIEGVRFKENIPEHVYIDMQKNNMYKYSYDFELKRMVDLKDISLIDRYGNKPFEDYDVGDYTNRFNTEQDVIDMFVLCVKNCFDGVWELWVHNTVRSTDYKLNI